jgi:Ca2+-binding EF-hand superfamily protein
MLAARLRHHDEDRDGRVTLDEVPDSTREAFSRVDTDGDGVVDASELAEFE